MIYRREIDGLRALAILPVIFFHAGFDSLDGGYIGVDVFFIISGFLITSIVLAEHERGTLTLIGFYERRARRILPALFFVMFVSLPFAWLWLWLSDMENFAESLIAVSLFASNFLFWVESGYFETAGEMKPLLHTWSLAVEEQYYLLYPFFLLFVWHLGKRRTGALAARSRLSLRSKQNCVRWAGLAFCLLLSACNKQDGPAMLEDYASRMSNVLETDITLDLSGSTRALPLFPGGRERLLPTVELREGVIDVWDFEQCGMIPIIAERNSSLGKVMLPSQKMSYEIRFIQALQDCRARVLAVIARDEAFIERLENIYVIKRQNLSAELWNGIYISDEISAQFIIKQNTLALKEEVGSVQRALEKFQALAKLSEQETIIVPPWLEDIEDNYFAMHSNHFGARLLATLPMVTQTLDKTAEAINIRLAQKPFCPAGHQPPRAKILRNVFQKYYAGQILPYMAMIQRDGKQWLQRHDEIMTLLPAPAAMQLYHQQVVSLSADNGLWQRWQRATRRHTKAWQDILGQCGMMPKRRPLT